VRALRGLVVAVVALALAAGDAASAPPVLDVQAHRGGMGLRPESSEAAFGHALELGVTTLELDVQISEDGQGLGVDGRRGVRAEGPPKLRLGGVAAGPRGCARRCARRTMSASACASPASLLAPEVPCRSR